MITHMSHTHVFVLDQESAKAFYTEKLGLELRFAITMGEEFEGAGAGFRWLTVGPKDQPDLQIILASCDMGRSPEAADQLRALVAGGSMGAGVMTTDDCRQTYRELRANGVTFLSEPSERPYGIEAMIRDDSGNMISLVQPSEFDLGDVARFVTGRCDGAASMRATSTTCPLPGEWAGARPGRVEWEPSQPDPDP